MNKFTKFLSLAGMFGLLLTGCTTNSSPSNPSTSDPSSTTSSITPPSSDPSTSSLDPSSTSEDPSTTSSDPTPSTSSVDTELLAKISEAEDYVASLDLSLYREAEKATLQEAIIALQGYLASEAVSITGIEAMLSSLKSLVASLKTDAEYTAEEEEAREAALAEAKAEKVRTLNFDQNLFRQEEMVALNNQRNAMIEEINALDSLEEIAAYDTSSLLNAVASSKTLSDYVVEEMNVLPYEGESLYSKSSGSYWEFNENAVRTSPQSYRVSHQQFGERLSFSFSVSGVGDIAVGGIMMVDYHDVATGNGVDGYLVNVVSNTANKFIQVFYLNNCYGNYGPSICDYIGGWVFPGETRGNEFRVEVTEDAIDVMDLDEYNAVGDTCGRISVKKDGSTVGLNYPVLNGSHISILNWDDEALDITLTDISSSFSVSGIELMKDLVGYYSSSIPPFTYSQSEMDELSSVYDSFIDNFDNGVIENYEQAKNAVFGMKSFVRTLANEHEADAQDKAAVVTQDIMSRAYPAPWPLINSNVSTYSLDPSDARIIKTNSMGYMLSEHTYGPNFTIVFSVDTTSVGIGQMGIMLRADVNEYGLNGYMVTIDNKDNHQFLQVWYCDTCYADTSSGASSSTTTYMGGWVYTNGPVAGVAFRVTVIGNTMSIWNNETYSIGKAPEVCFDLNNVYTGAGHIGVINWNFLEADIMIHEFKVL